MIYSIQNKKKHRCSGSLSLHVLNIIDGIHKSAVSRKSFNIKTTCEKPKFFTNKDINSIIK